MLNHYIGMHDLAVEDFTEFKWMPFALGRLALLFLRAAVLGTVKELVGRDGGASCTSAAFSLWSFGYRMYRYGHDLAPNGAGQSARRSRRRSSAIRRSPTSRCTRIRSRHVRARRRVVVLLAAASWLAWRNRRAAASSQRRPMHADDAALFGSSCWPRIRQAMTAPAAAARPRRPAGGRRTRRRSRRGSMRPRTAARSTSSPARYVGDLVHRPADVRLVGHGRPRLAGSGHGSVSPRPRADVVVEGFDIDGRARREPGWTIRPAFTSPRRTSTVRDCPDRGQFFGIYLREADDAIDRADVVIRGVPGRDPASRAPGCTCTTAGAVHAASGTTSPTCATASTSSRRRNGLIRGNIARRLRYGLHYMFSDDNVFEDNLFEDGAAGAAIMYSKRLMFRRNRFLHNRGFASVGLLLKDCDDVRRRGQPDCRQRARPVSRRIGSEQPFRRNRDRRLRRRARALRLEPRAIGSTATRSSANLSPLELVGRRTDTGSTGTTGPTPTSRTSTATASRSSVSAQQRVRSPSRQSHGRRSLRTRARRRARSRRPSRHVSGAPVAASVVDRASAGLRVPALRERAGGAVDVNPPGRPDSGLVWSGSALSGAGAGGCRLGRAPMTRPEAA